MRRKDKYDREYDTGKLKKVRTHKAMNFNEEKNSFSSLFKDDKVGYKRANSNFKDHKNNSGFNKDKATFNKGKGGGFGKKRHNQNKFRNNSNNKKKHKII